MGTGKTSFGNILTYVYLFQILGDWRRDKPADKMEEAGQWIDMVDDGCCIILTHEPLEGGIKLPPFTFCDISPKPDELRT